MNDTLVIIPAFNEGKSIQDVIENIRSQAPMVDMVVINDASTDNTAQAALKAGVPVVTLPINLGIGGAVQTGFRYAVEHGYSYTIQIDGDGQHDPKHIPELLESLKNDDFDCMIGSRYVQKTEYKTPWSRRVGMIIFSSLLTRLMGKRITDTTSGYRALNHRATMFFAAEYPVDFPDSEALLLLHRNKMRIGEIPVTMSHRAHGRSSTGLWKSIYYPFKSLIAILAVLLRSHKSIQS